MTGANATHPHFSHSLLVHGSDEELLEGTRAFVDQGLASAGRVLVHGTRDRLGLMRDALGSHPLLEYGFDEESYLAPTRTLFAYQRRLAEIPDQSEFWVTGTVPMGDDSAGQAAWNRYESAVNEALAAYPFRALCTYDTRTRPSSVIDAARATHSVLGYGHSSHTNPLYVDPTAYLTDPQAQVPAPPSSPPSVATTVTRLEHLTRARQLLVSAARSDSAVPSSTIDKFIIAVHEVAANGLVHGSPPVHITQWATLGALICLVEDSGRGDLDPLTGFRFPEEWGPMGLWAARQVVDDLFIGRSRSGGCSVLLIAS